MKHAILLHGTLGSPTSSWLQWLKTEMEGRGLQVWVPQLPHAEQPSLQELSLFVHANCPFPLDSDTLVVGHSSGAVLALVLAEQQNATPLGGVVAVSAFHDNSLNWEPNNRLFDVTFIWSEIAAGTKKLLFVHSDNDPYVPLDQAQYIAKRCEAELVVIPGQGHFNVEHSEAYRAFPKLLELMEQKDFLSLKT